MNRKFNLRITYDDTKTTPSRLIHVVGNAEGVIKSIVIEIEKWTLNGDRNMELKANEKLKEFRSELLDGMMIWQKDKKVLGVLNHVLEEFDKRFPNIKQQGYDWTFIEVKICI